MTRDSAEETWLDHEDSSCRKQRAARLKWIAELASQTDHWQFPGGWLAKSLFEEARYCFVYGQFLAVVALGMAYIEHTLAAKLYALGRSDMERANIKALLQEAVGHGWLTEADLAGFDVARLLRNPIMHFRRPFDEEKIECRSIESDELPYDIIEKDARHVIQMVFQLLSRQAG